MRPGSPHELRGKLHWRRMRNDVQIGDYLCQHYQCDRLDGFLNVLVGKEFGYWHLSISHQTYDNKPGRYPTWDEIADARYELLPDNTIMVMALPPKDAYINAHPTTFHLHEAPEMRRRFVP